MGKYDKYFIKYGINTPKVDDMRPLVARMDDSVARGSNFYLVHWVAPGFGDILGDYEYAGHPPHIHKSAELLMHIGGDPDNPMELNAEIEMYMGPELERHTFTESTIIWIPPNFIHSPWRPLRVDKPFLFIEINQGPEHTEKFYPQLLPKEAREKIDWSMWPDKGFKKEVDMPYKVTDSCLKCGYCIERCPEEAIIADEKEKMDELLLQPVHIDVEICTDCGVCVSEEWWCPAQAIEEL